MTERCGVKASIGDDHGDNFCTFPCQLEKDHEGYHQEKFIVGGFEFIIKFKENIE